ncbi:MAG: rod shape-determining protein MreC [Deltaproteobacteria bacterium]|nr:rod shape-determining protein MreC [Deltaproteobacteria bacterium]
MALSLRSIRNGALIAVLLGIPVLLLRSTAADPHGMSAFDRAVRRIGAPLEAAVSYSAGMLGAFFERWVLQAQLQDTNERIAGENRELRQRMRELVHLQEENQQLRRALQMREKVPDDMIPAERVGVDQSPFFRVVNIRIDRGSEYARTGMAVLSPDGVVGRIDKSFDDYSDVMLITDPRSKIAVELARTKAQGILEGRTEDSCTLEVPKDFDVQVGELVQTSGVDELFPKGHPVGQVTEVEPLVGDKQRLHVVPAVRFDRIDVVWVVLANAPRPDPHGERARKAVQARGLQPIQ